MKCYCQTTLIPSDKITLTIDEGNYYLIAAKNNLDRKEIIEEQLLEISSLHLIIQNDSIRLIHLQGALDVTNIYVQQLEDDNKKIHKQVAVQRVKGRILTTGIIAGVVFIVLKFIL